MKGVPNPFSVLRKLQFKEMGNNKGTSGGRKEEEDDRIKNRPTGTVWPTLAITSSLTEHQSYLARKGIAFLRMWINLCLIHQCFSMQNELFFQILNHESFWQKSSTGDHSFPERGVMTFCVDWCRTQIPISPFLLWTTKKTLSSLHPQTPF